MAKIAIIDSLARSGTTLLSALMNSQENCISYRGVFHEPLSCDLGSWPHGMVKRALIGKEIPLMVKKGKKPQYSGLRKYFSLNNVSAGTVNIYWDTLRENTIKSLSGNYPESVQKWTKYFDMKNASIDDLDAIYQEIADEKKADLMVMRWNQGLCYINKWLRNDNHYWISAIRNPMDRACSSHKTHNWKWKDSLMSYEKFISSLEKVRGMDKVHIVYYEDLVHDPKKEIGKIFEALGMRKDHINVKDLRIRDGEPYRSEKADLVDIYGTHKIGEEFKGFYNQSIGRYKDEMPAKVLRDFERTLSGYKLLQRYF